MRIILLMLMLAGCTETKATGRLHNPYDFGLGRCIVAGFTVLRCENDEVVCYIYREKGGMQCLFKD